MASYGFVYILNHDFMPDIYKIGFTDRAPMQRVKELSASTSIPSDFNIVMYGEFENAQEIEKFLHGELKDYRVSPNREFFVMDVSLIIKYILPWFVSGSINFTECSEYKNILSKYDNILYKPNQENPASIDDREDITEEIVVKAAELIDLAASAKGGKNA